MNAEDNIKGGLAHADIAEDTRVVSVFDMKYFEEHDHSRDNPLTGLGSGDCKLYLNVLPEDLAGDIFTAVDEEIEWNVMNHKGSQVPRLISIQGDVGPDGEHPLYRHPADEQPELVPWTPMALACRDLVSQRVGQDMNHALIQKYRSGRDNIGEHADKTLDIQLGSDIANLSLGASRVMILKAKADYTPEGHVCPSAGKIYQRITLPHNSVFVLGWQTNRDFLHAIRSDKRPASLKDDHELLHDQQRISLTFRLIATFISPPSAAEDGSGSVIVGQGARKKGAVERNIADCAADNSEADILAQSHQMLNAFSAENKTSHFDWDEHYGQGFDIVNFCFMNGK